MVIIIAAILTTAVGSEPWSDAQTSLFGIILALGSNVCFALRNIGTKYYSEKDETERKTSIQGIEKEYSSLNYKKFRVYVEKQTFEV